MQSFIEYISEAKLAGDYRSDAVKQSGSRFIVSLLPNDRHQVVDNKIQHDQPPIATRKSIYSFHNGDQGYGNHPSPESSDSWSNIKDFTLTRLQRQLI